MQLTSINVIKNLCKKLDIRPSKKLGQNFLINKNILDKIIKAGELSKRDNVLEIGPGFGVLTQELLKYTKNLTIVEKDKRLVEFLGKEIKGLKIINDDILKISNFQDTISKQIPNSKFQIQNYKIISNLPYQITSPVLWKFLHEEKNKPEMMVLMVQKEVAERIISKPGKMSILSVMCQFYADIKLVSWVNRKNFYPEPDVDSAIIKFKIQDSR
ncbi:MAG: 16S rRNA (adenine(1518)-N(6)/adenine(1519)-N(6))-dimethyltransferase RsmA, partial [Patescibacteria group bacterium]